MLLVGYCFGIRSERRLCEKVHLNLAYRWFCRLDLSDRIPDHSTFSKTRRFRESALLRQLFETTVARCIEEGLVSGQRMPSYGLMNDGCYEVFKSNLKCIAILHLLVFTKDINYSRLMGPLQWETFTLDPCPYVKACGGLHAPQLERKGPV